MLKKRCEMIWGLFLVIGPDEKADSGFVRQSQTIFRCERNKCGLIKISQFGYRRAMMSSSKQSHSKTRLNPWQSFYRHFFSTLVLFSLLSRKAEFRSGVCLSAIALDVRVCVCVCVCVCTCKCMCVCVFQYINGGSVTSVKHFQNCNAYNCNTLLGLCSSQKNLSFVLVTNIPKFSVAHNSTD
jgi:hypothetical protein